MGTVETSKMVTSSSCKVIVKKMCETQMSIYEHLSRGTENKMYNFNLRVQLIDLKRSIETALKED